MRFGGFLLSRNTNIVSVCALHFHTGGLTGCAAVHAVWGIPAEPQQDAWLDWLGVWPVLRQVRHTLWSGLCEVFWCGIYWIG